MRRFPHLLLVLLLLAVGAVLSRGQDDSAPEAPPLVLATTQSLGALEPCDCVEGMLGGYPRRLSQIERERAKAAGRALVLDGGDLTGKDFHPRLLETKTRAALDLLRQARARVVAVGERDLRLGVDTLKRLAVEAGVRLVAENVRRGEETPFPAAPSIRVGAETVHVVAVLDPELGDPTGTLTLEDPRAPVRAAVARRAKAGGRIVVLFHGSGQAAERALADVGLGLDDIIIAGHDQQRAVPVRQCGTTWLVESLRDARALTRIALGERPRATHLRLDRHVPDDPRARARVERYFADVQGLPEPPRKPTEGGAFVGSQTCKACHQEQAAVFEKTKHHEAQTRILALKPKRAKAAECTVCHVVGYGYEGGFQDLQQTPHLAEVGCESCHGVGGNHVARGGGRGYGLLPGFPDSWRPVCVTCHDPTNSPGFDFPKALESIKHWKDRGERSE